MSIPSNERIAALALKCAGDAWKGGCIVCNMPFELHEIQKRQMRKTMGAAVAILGANLAPLCAYHHAEWSTFSQEKQIDMLHGYFIAYTALQHAQRDQLIAIKARCSTCN